jgi:hypothetical protein
MQGKGRKQIDPAMIRRWLRGWGRWCLLGAFGLVGPAVVAGPAGATGSYPGETLTVTQAGPAVAGQAVNFLATGQQSDVNEYAGGFSLDVFEKDPSVDPTCAPDYWDESNNAITDPTELHFIVGDWEGSGTTFSVPFKAVFSHPAAVLLCAYSTWITDTAASAQLTVDVTSPAPPPGGGQTPGAPTSAPTVAKPVNEVVPRVIRQRNKLRCSTGTWSNSPASFSFRWVAGGRQVRAATQARLTVSRKIRGHQVRCRVSATNSAGTTTALSRPLWVH